MLKTFLDRATIWIAEALNDALSLASLMMFGAVLLLWAAILERALR